MTNTSASTQIERAIRLEGAFNVRDLGGLQTSSGDTVRMGRLYRADSLSTLTDHDLELLAGKSLATVIDLRTSYELQKHGATRLVDSGAHHVHIPILEGDMSDQGIHERPESLGDLYAQMVERDSARFVGIFETIADPARTPAVIHCTAGKDRTGVTTALILGLLGVPKETIVADYILTDANMTAMLEFRAKAGTPLGFGNIPDHYHRAMPETMIDFLTVLEERWGTIDAYLDHIGVPTEARNAIRETMLT
jgi:protein-tyrosine phosphatase